MKIDLQISSPTELRDAVEGYNVWDAYCRAAIDINGVTRIDFGTLTIEDETMVIANAVSLVRFLCKLINQRRSILEVHTDARAYGVPLAGRFEIFNFDNDQHLEHIYEEDIYKLLDEIKDFFETAFRQVHPGLCDFLVKHKFLISDALS